MKVRSPLTLISLTNYINIFKATYYEVIGLVVGAMYACAPQGRINGIITLRLGQALDIYTDGLTMTTEFKTQEYYGFQPVLFPPLVRQILAFYLDKSRPVVEAMQPELTLPDSPLFPSMRCPGTKADIAQHMQAFYMRTGGKLLRQRVFTLFTLILLK